MLLGCSVEGQVQQVQGVEVSLPFACLVGMIPLPLPRGGGGDGDGGGGDGTRDRGKDAGRNWRKGGGDGADRDGIHVGQKAVIYARTLGSAAGTWTWVHVVRDSVSLPNNHSWSAGPKISASASNRWSDGGGNGLG